jgi:signal transduction histidine kinase
VTPLVAIPPPSGPNEPIDRAQLVLLADLTHDLKNPLAVVRGGAQLLNRRLSRPGPLDPGAVREGLALIESATGRMTLLLEDLLDAVAAGADRNPALDRRPVDLLRLARQAAARYQGTTERHTVRVEAGDATVVGSWDPARLERVLANLLSNALKFSPDGGEVVVVVSVDGGGAVLTVADQGLGIPADDLDRVFDRRYRGANVVGRVPGTGLGLAAVRQVVEAHGGSIAVATREGVGTTFRVWLPITPEVGW